MSTTYSIVCHDCEESYWVGQGSNIYDTELTARFLHKHKGRKLEFNSDYAFDDYVWMNGYTDFEGKL